MDRRIPLSALLAAALLAGAPAAAAAQPQEDPDWPCVQRKVPSLTPAAIWTGPVVEEGTLDWRADPEVAGLVGRLSQRRLPLEDAKAEIAAFAAAMPPEERERRLTLLFAGLFDTMNAERSEILDGIDRYARRLKELAAEIRAESAKAAPVPGVAAAPTGALTEAETTLQWRTRIFNERRGALSYVCEVPRLVEQRLFALGRAISAELKD